MGRILARCCRHMAKAALPHPLVAATPRRSAMRLLSFTRHDDNLPLLGVRYGARILDIAAAARIAGSPECRRA